MFHYRYSLLEQEPLKIIQKEPHFISISSDFADHELAEELLECGYGYN
jgi:hypothetical protein